jgi:BirA family biotin operon repressor/biotin-[acetyl-CoA-carboxylase] ligase
MQIIKLDATESTNTYLKELAAKKELPDFTVVMTTNQTLGRGQLYSTWESEEGKNLAFSILKNYNNLSIDQGFLISVTVSLAILDSLRQLGIPKLSIKWPNDILSGDFKIGGILIENMISGTKIKRSVIGFGLNVNQQKFINAPHAASLKQIIGHNFDLESVFHSLIDNLNKNLSRTITSRADKLFMQYHSNLFRMGELSRFLVPDGQSIDGIIKGVSHNGKLKVAFIKGDIHEFGLKEIQLQY